MTSNKLPFTKFQIISINIEGKEVYFNCEIVKVFDQVVRVSSPVMVIKFDQPVPEDEKRVCQLFVIQLNAGDDFIERWIGRFPDDEGIGGRRVLNTNCIELISICGENGEMPKWIEFVETDDSIIAKMSHSNGMTFWSEEWKSFRKQIIPHDAI